MWKKILLGLLFVFIIIQFIRPEKNQSNDLANDISTMYPLPENVHSLMKTACYDCHSNYTEYPWYDQVQPVYWWINSHIEDGKRHLNFSEFAAYTPKKQAHKLEEVAELVEEGEMPLESYTWMHSESQLTAEQRELLVNWAKGLRQEILAKNPVGGE